MSLNTIVYEHDYEVEILKRGLNDWKLLRITTLEKFSLFFLDLFKIKDY